MSKFMRYSELTTAPIMVLLLATICLMFYPILVVSSQVSTAVVVEPSTVSVHLGESFDVTVSLSNVQNLYGLEILLNWNPAVLRVANIDIHLGVETFSDGVLHESSYSPPIFIAENNLTQTRGEYRLVATSMAPAPSFSGSGSIVRITFEPIILGDSALDLESQLYDYPPVDRDPRTSSPLEHTTLGSFVTVEEQTLPSSALTPTPTYTSTPTLTPTLSPTAEPSTLNLKIEYVLTMSAATIMVIVLLLLILRRRK